jgi:hypothetical protein
MDTTLFGRGYRASRGGSGLAIPANMADRLIYWKDNDIIGFY